MHSVQNLLVLMRSGNGQNVGMMLADVVRFRAKAARHDHFAILFQCLANRIEAFGLSTIKEATCIYDHRIRARIIGRNTVALGAQPRQDTLAINQRLGATKADHTDTGLTGARGVGQFHLRCEIGAKRRRVLCHDALPTPRGAP